MQKDVKEVFYFHAAANSLGGHIDAPYRVIHAQASVALPAVGGYASTRLDDFKFEEIVSCRSTYTHVAGRTVQTNGPWKARVTSVIEGLNILNVVTADRAVARFFAEFPADGGAPRVSFAGTHFHNLRFEGKEAGLTFNSTLLPAHHRGGDVYNEDESVPAEIEWQVLQEVAQQQSRALRDTADIPGWAVERYGWVSSTERTANGGFAICSLVDRVETAVPGQSFGHFLEIPDIGRFFLAEALVHPRSVELTMIRADLGCATQGQASAASGVVGGHTMPP